MKQQSTIVAIAILAFGMGTFNQAIAQTWKVTTIAGSDEGNRVMDGQGNKAQFAKPSYSAIDANNNLYLIDETCVRKVDTAGNVISLFGMGAEDQNHSRINIPESPGQDGIWVTKSGNLYVSSGRSHAVYKITPDKKVELFAGEEGFKGKEDGNRMQASFYNPTALCMDKAGNMYIADAYNGMVRKLDVNGNVKTMAGNGNTSDFKPGLSRDAQFGQVRAIAVDSKGNVYVAVNGGRGNCVAKINPQGVVSSFVGDYDGLRPPGTNDGTGKTARFMRINALAIDKDDNLIIGENTRVRKATPSGVVTTLAGNETEDFRDAIGSKAMFRIIRGLSIDSNGNILVSDGTCIRKMEKQ
ncbi:MAG: SMP-30/gluconolactonase/LRE family protein [Chitinophagaceae bacterium]|nr:SMP-30/gluconolactonase/LRE family protein [Chitinophagaceae bacterium]